MNAVTRSIWIPLEPNVIAADGLNEIPQVGFYRPEKQLMFWSARDRQMVSYKASFHHNHPHVELELWLQENPSPKDSKTSSGAAKDGSQEDR